MENEGKMLTGEEMRLNKPDPLLHSQLRLAIISLLAGSEAAEFTYLKEQTGATAGSLSIQITKLREAFAPLDVHFVRLCG